MPCLVSPFYRHGNITSYLKKHPGVNKLALITQVASGLSYLHSQFIVHGDLKGSNILINDNGEASLTDFGLSIILQTSGFTTKTASGTMRYMAPELYSICDEENEDPIPRVTMATDVWAFAMTIIEIFTESIPFSHTANDASIILYVKAGGRPKRDGCPSVNDQIWSVLERCWDVEASRRPSTNTLSRFFGSQ
jgi:serine/threonine protein kinase